MLPRQLSHAGQDRGVARYKENVFKNQLIILLRVDEDVRISLHVASGSVIDEVFLEDNMAKNIKNFIKICILSTQQFQF